MDSVAIDLFAMPAITHAGHTYDTMAVCVDRQSGWMVVTPYQDNGVTGEKVAKAMCRQWDMFGVHSVVISDRGPQFASAWWMSICADLGVRRAYGQAYHHQANGRAEMTGQRIRSVLSSWSRMSTSRRQRGRACSAWPAFRSLQTCLESPESPHTKLYPVDIGLCNALPTSRTKGGRSLRIHGAHATGGPKVCK